MGRIGGRVTALVALLTLAAGATSAHAAPLRAGVGVVDATWHVGASAGQYASSPSAQSEFDPSAHATLKAPSYGVQSRLQVRALVVSDGTRKVAIVKDDLYIPQDLLGRRAAQILEAGDTGITRDNLVVAVTHSHSSPYYTSTAWGAWTFQDVFDIRAYGYYARRIADAVTVAARHTVPVRVSADVTTYARSNRNALGPAVADDGTPAGFPDSYTDRDMALVRFDDVSDPRRPRPLANLLSFSQHGESNEGNDLISADWVGPVQRMLDRRTGAVTVFAQNAVGTSENERNAYHSIHERLWFDHRDYAQSEYGAALMTRAAEGLWRRAGAGKGRVRPFTDAPVAMADHWFPGPLTHPFPTVSNCRTDTAIGGNPQLPVVGLPDCAGPRSAFEVVGLTPPPDPPQNPGPSLDDLKRAGIPLPDNYGASSYTALEEDVSVHLQAFRIGEIAFTVCSCEQWADQARNIKTRLDRTPGNEWMGFDWTTYRGLSGQDAPCARTGEDRWSCPDPTKACELKGTAFTNTCRGSPRDARLTGITDHEMARMRAQVQSCANGWNAPSWAPYAESEPVDPKQIKGSYTCDDGDASARLGYDLVIPISMANDYNGYIATYREYQRGDHYRKALTGWGPHSSDYLATRLVKLARGLHGGPSLDRTVDGAPDPDADDPLLEAKARADLAANDVKARVLGETADRVERDYTALLPDDGGLPGPVTQPRDVQRFDVAAFTWRGGSNYVDDPDVRVERRDGRTGRWTTFAGQEGELPVTLRFPGRGDAPAYLTGGQEWRWTAWFEAFVSRFDLPGSPRATPAGTYRFVAAGRHRRGGVQHVYRVVSAPFRVGAWTGVPAPVVRARRGRAVTVRTGTIDFPDTYDDRPGRPRFVRGIRTILRDPAAPGDLRRAEQFCFTCSFRPWADVTGARRVVVTFARGARVVARATARRTGPGRFTTRRRLRAGESAYVCAGDLRDAWGDRTSVRSGVAGRALADPRCPARPAPVGEPNRRRAAVVVVR